MLQYEDKWVVIEGYFLSLLVHNHSWEIVPNLGSQVMTPEVEHDDNA